MILLRLGYFLRKIFLRLPSVGFIVFGGAALSAGVPAIAMAQLMVLPGKFDISPQGSASFNIPISVPPGTAGMVPSLSIDYTSGSGNGPLGVGWSLGGLSAITRCPQTLAQDNNRGSITYDVGVASGQADTDRFCLNGQRLVVASGLYGANGAIYHTETESFANVTSVGTTGNSPSYFVVQTKSGQTMEFGNTATSPNSQPMLTATPAITSPQSWLLDKVTDTTGNYMVIKYVSNPSNLAGDSEVLPSEIDYTGNPTGAVPYNKVTFVYGSRTDAVPLYTAGALVENTQILTDIETWYGTQSAPGSTKVNDYKLAYTASSSTGRELLASITMCDGAGSNCLPARTFTYQSDGLLPGGLLPTASVNTNFAGLNGSYKGYRIYPADFAGSGQGGALLVTSGSQGVANGNGVKVLLNQGGATVVVNATNAATGTSLASTINGFTPAIGDFNGDGKEDVFWINFSGPTDYLWLGNGDGTFNVVTNPISLPYEASANKVLVGDFNGDGKTDLFFYYADSYGRLSGNGSYYNVSGIGLATSSCSNQSSCLFLMQYSIVASPPTQMPFIIDLNGDGKSDIVWMNENGPNDSVNIPTGYSTSYASVWYGPITLLSTLSSQTYPLSSVVSSSSAAININSAVGYTPIFGDFNGDGLPDILWYTADIYKHSIGSQMLWTNRGNGTFQSTAIASSISNAVFADGPSAGDFNGDGVSDILWDNENTDGGSNGYRTIWTSTGSGFSVSTYGATTNVAGENGNLTDSGHNYATNSFHPILGDFNGDGKSDILWDDYDSNGNSQGTRELWSSDGIQPDLLTSVTNGVGASTAVTYGTLSEGFGNYYLGWNNAACSAAPASYPTVDISAPVPVVTSTASSTGIATGNPYQSNFSYACARVDVSGRGFLGFASQYVQDPQTNILQTSNFLQTFPYIGVLSSQTKTYQGVSPAITLNSTINSYIAATGTANAATTAITCPAALSAPIPTLPWTGTQFPYLYTSVVASNDLDGTALPTATSNFTYDQYGDALTVSICKSLNGVAGSTQQTTNKYQPPNLNTPNANSWILGRLINSSVTSTTP